jgi:hypothetical protein
MLYAEDTNKIRYIKSTSNRVYTEDANKVIYIEFASYWYSVLLIAEYKLVYTFSKIDIG